MGSLRATSGQSHQQRQSGGVPRGRWWHLCFNTPQVSERQNPVTQAGYSEERISKSDTFPRLGPHVLLSKLQWGMVYFCKLGFVIESLAASACGCAALIFSGFPVKWEGTNEIMSQGERSLVCVKAIKDLECYLCILTLVAELFFGWSSMLIWGQNGFLASVDI